MISNCKHCWDKINFECSAAYGNILNQYKNIIDEISNTSTCHDIEFLIKIIFN